jgi:hypothetical protein
LLSLASPRQSYLRVAKRVAIMVGRRSQTVTVGRIAAESRMIVCRENLSTGIASSIR